MNRTMLTVTRALLKATVAITAFIINQQVKIVAAAKVIHAWAIKATVAAADKRSAGAYVAYSNSVDAAQALRRAATVQYDKYCASCVDADLTRMAANEELATLA